MEKQSVSEETAPQKQVSKHDFYFEMPLYEWVEESQLDEELLDGDVDAYSARNGIDTTYTISSRSMGDYSSDVFNNFLKISLKCKRKNDDTLCFIVYVGKLNGMKVYAKVGQLPSLADTQFAEIGKKYDKFLSREDMKEFKRAIGLAAHGVGAGSFVYLRRIFEKLVFDTFKKHASELGMTEIAFAATRMEDKIEILKAYLPSHLLKMKSVYQILSKGVHELSEQECLEYFGVLKLSIELILEQRIENEAKEQREVAVQKQLQEIVKKLK